MKFTDVSDIDVKSTSTESPKSFVTIHRDKGYRQFQMSETASYSSFFSKCSEYIDSALELVYEDDYLQIRQHIHFCAPGTYVILYKQVPSSLSDASLESWFSSVILQREIRKVLRTQCDIDLVSIFSEQKGLFKNELVTSVISFDRAILKSLDIPVSDYQLQIGKYLSCFKVGKRNLERIKEINSILKKHLNKDSFKVYKRSMLSILKSEANLPDRSVFQDVDSNYLAPIPLSSITSQSIGNTSSANSEDFDFVEPLSVVKESDTPIPPEGYRYFNCIGGEKEYQSFLAPKSWSRGFFMKKYSNHLDPVLRDVYSSNGIFIRQDASRAVPGFYIIGPESFTVSVDTIAIEDLMRCVFLTKKIIEIERGVLGIKTVNMYYDENFGKPVHVHFWALPFYEKELSNVPPLHYNQDTWEYLERFPFQRNKEKILEFNDVIRSEIKSRGIIEQDNELLSFLKNSPINTVLS